MERTNEITLIFDSLPVNEALARITAASFCTQLNPTLEELADVKTALSEAVTNSIVHGYEGEIKKIVVECRIEEREVYIAVKDQGCGIENVQQAMEPLFTTKPDAERAGMGFAFMEAFMDEVRVESMPGKGTSVFMRKKIGQSADRFFE